MKDLLIAIAIMSSVTILPSLIGAAWYWYTYVRTPPKLCEADGCDRRARYGFQGTPACAYHSRRWCEECQTFHAKQEDHVFWDVVA